MAINKMIYETTMTTVSDDGARYGVMQFGDRVYEEVPLGATHNLREFVHQVLKLVFRNDDNNDLASGLDAARDMLETL